MNRVARERILSGMTRRPATRADCFEPVRRLGLALPDVEAATRYGGSPVLRLGGCFMAGLATHESAEADTLVVRSNFEDREWPLEGAPETYYVTDYFYRFGV